MNPDPGANVQSEAQSRTRVNPIDRIPWTWDCPNRQLIPYSGEGSLIEPVGINCMNLGCEACGPHVQKAHAQDAYEHLVGTVYLDYIDDDQRHNVRRQLRKAGAVFDIIPARNKRLAVFSTVQVKGMKDAAVVVNLLDTLLQVHQQNPHDGRRRSYSWSKAGSKDGDAAEPEAKRRRCFPVNLDGEQAAQMEELGWVTRTRSGIIIEVLDLNELPWMGIPVEDWWLEQWHRDHPDAIDGRVVRVSA